MDNELRSALDGLLLALGDDELILGHRDSEWTGHAPILEEDIAFANLALDEIGHAQLWYGLLADLRGADHETYPDELVFWRSPQDFRCVQMVELPNRDWAFSMLRQYLFDAAEAVRLKALSRSSYQPAAGVADKISKEESYHLRHTRAWVRRLGLGTDESRHRMQSALDQIWPLAGQLFTPVPGEDQLVAAGVTPAGETLRMEWEEKVRSWLQDGGLTIPEVVLLATGREQHTPHLEVLVTEMQSIARTDREADWT